MLCDAGRQPGAAQLPSRRSSAASSRASSARINRSSSLPNSSPHPVQSAATLMQGPGPVDPSTEGSHSRPPSSGAGVAAARRTSSAGLHRKGRSSSAAADDSGQSACLLETAKGTAEAEASGSSRRRLRQSGGEGRAAAAHEAQVKQMESVIADLQQTVLQGCLERAQLQSQLSLLQTGTPADASVPSPGAGRCLACSAYLHPCEDVRCCNSHRRDARHFFDWLPECFRPERCQQPDQEPGTRPPGSSSGSEQHRKPCSPATIQQHAGRGRACIRDC